MLVTAISLANAKVKLPYHKGLKSTTDYLTKDFLVIYLQQNRH